ncbi:MAG: SUMF1/EgtB/PvdO family nonheme iron enzyme [Chloroflexota bacterium]
MPVQRDGSLMPYLFLSARPDDLNFARLVKIRLEDEGRTTWLDEGVEFVSPTGSLNRIEDVIQYAGLVIAINGGSADDLAIAHRFQKPILALRLGEDPAILLPEIEARFPDEGSARLTPLPKPIDTAESRKMEQSRRSTDGSSSGWIFLVAGIVIVLVIVGVLLTRNQSSAPPATPTANAALLRPSETATRAATLSLLQATSTLPPLILPSATIPTTDLPTATTINLADSPTVTLTSTVASTRPPTKTPTQAATATLTATPTETLTPTPTVTNTATLTPSPTFTATATFTLAPTFTLTPTATIPALNATLIPLGSANSFWIPIERQIQGLAMVYATGCCFVSGAGQPGNPSGESLCLEPYWISKTEITNEQYAACVDAGVCTMPAVTSSRTHRDYFGDSRFADFPVINVTWEQAHDYSVWIGGSLPNQLEWSYAAQGPASWPYPWGSQAPDPTRLNFNGEIGDVTAVGTYPSGASWLGALDLAGNVWEWTSTSTNASNKVICGGSWNSYEGLVSANSHAENHETDSNGYTGFRLVMDVAT